MLVNGKKALLGDFADISSDVITFDGKKVNANSESHTYLMLNKPRGYVTTLSDESGRATVKDLIPTDKRLFPVGRLDMYSEGLLLMTDDGQLTYKLTHPKHEIPKEYLVKITLTEKLESTSLVAALLRPVVLDGVSVKPYKCRIINDLGCGKYILLITIMQGKNRQIRRMCALNGMRINSLKRVAIGSLKLGDLPTGEYRNLTLKETEYLKNL